MNATALPALRDELSIMPGPADADGAPSWTLHDPLTNRFFRLSWPAFEILSRWSLGDASAVVDKVKGETTLDLDAEDVDDIVSFLGRSQLLISNRPAAVERLLGIYDASRNSWLNWLLHHYLFFRIPLVRSDALLSRWLPWVAWMGQRPFWLATLAAFSVGLFLVARQWDVFAATFVDHVSLPGLAAFGVALGLAKVIHELGHGFTAKSMGCRVPTMGLAFLVMWPVLYTDVNEVWKLNSRRQRLLVGSAGILAELTLAAWATLAWGLLPDGPFRSMAFVLAATTWISSLAINLSPFMRFDGYFLAMDALNQPNLHPRSFALARWHLREVLFKLNEPPPEHLSASTRAAMIVFAWCVWIYRLVLFLGIAVLVYHFFIKVVGIVLFAVEMIWFVFNPIVSEIAQWRKRLGTIRQQGRTRISLLLAGLALLLVALPWSGRVSAPAVLKAERHVALYAPVPAVLTEIQAVNGQQVKAGDRLARMVNPDLLLYRQQVERQASVLRFQISASGFDDTFRANLRALTQELEGAEAQIAALSADIDRLDLVSPMDGVVVDVASGLNVGQWINHREPLLGLVFGSIIEAYVADDDLVRIATGSEARFVPEGRGAGMDAQVVSIDRVAVKSLSEPILAVPYGGEIAARFDNKALVPDRSVYRVRLKLDMPVIVGTPLRGRVLIDGERRSLLGHAARSAAAVLIREWGM